MLSGRGTPDLAALIGMKGVDASGSQPAVQQPQAVQEGAGELATAAGDEDGGDRMRGALARAPGGAPEVMVHKESALANSDELSPEAQAVHVGAVAGRPEDEKARVI